MRKICSDNRDHLSRQATLSRLVADIDQAREHGNLSSAIRVFVLEYFCTHRMCEERSNQRAAE